MANGSWIVNIICRCRIQAQSKGPGSIGSDSCECQLEPVPFALVCARAVSPVRALRNGKILKLGRRSDLEGDVASIGKLNGCAALTYK